MGLLDQTMGVQEAPVNEMPAGQARKATPEEQEHFGMIIKQAMEFIMQEENLSGMVEMSEQTGPAETVATYVKRTLDSIYMAAQEAGAQVSPTTMSAAADAVAQIVSAMLAQSGIDIDPASVAQEAMSLMEGM